MPLMESVVLGVVKHTLNHSLKLDGDKKPIHAFPVLRPDLPESERVIDEIIGWFNDHSPKDI